jgi:hypothetical protein
MSDYSLTFILRYVAPNYTQKFIAGVNLVPPIKTEIIVILKLTPINEM